MSEIFYNPIPNANVSIEQLFDPEFLQWSGLKERDADDTARCLVAALGCPYREIGQVRSRVLLQNIGHSSKARRLYRVPRAS
jgi:hypothetical protein